MSPRPLIVQRSLKEQVYDYLRLCLQRGRLSPGSVIDMNKTCLRLGVSKTPLREALLQLESEGFVKILPRRGVVVRDLTDRDIRDSYEIIGALEASALDSALPSLGAAEFRAMEGLIKDMARAIKGDDFDLYYERNLRFHDVYLTRSGNAVLIKIVRDLKKRLYDFPRPQRFIREWEVASIAEHRRLVGLLRAGRRREALRFIRDVHWSYDVQAKYIRRYYPSAVRHDRPVGNSGAGRPGRRS